MSPTAARTAAIRARVASHQISCPAVIAASTRVVVSQSIRAGWIAGMSVWLAEDDPRSVPRMIVAMTNATAISAAAAIHRPGDSRRPAAIGVTSADGIGIMGS